MIRTAAAAGLVGIVLAITVAGVWTALSAGLGSPPDRATTQSRPVASAAINRSFELFDGGEARLADWHGGPLVVNFWASWCPPCVAEMRDALEPIHQQLRGQVTFVGLNLQDTPDRAEAIVEQSGVTYVLGLDPSGELFTAFGGIGMPTTVFLDEAGAVVHFHTGAFTRDQLRALIQSKLGV